MIIAILARMSSKIKIKFPLICHTFIISILISKNSFNFTFLHNRTKTIPKEKFLTCMTVLSSHVPMIRGKRWRHGWSVLRDKMLRAPATATKTVEPSLRRRRATNQPRKLRTTFSAFLVCVFCIFFLCILYFCI